MRLSSTSLVLLLSLTSLSSACGKVSTGDDDDDSVADAGPPDAPGDVTVVSLSVEPANQEIRTGETLQLAAVAELSDGTSEDVTDRATWDSDSEEVATVDAGLVTGIAAGATVIHATFQSATNSVDLNVRASLGSTPDNPGASCLDILDQGESNGDGSYYINPSGTQVLFVHCDMTTDGGGWIYTWWNDAERFDGVYMNNIGFNDMGPVTINQWGDIWNAESYLGFSETLFGCTTQDDAAAYYWRYDGQPQIWFSMQAESSVYNNNFASVASNTVTSGCFAALKTTAAYGFAVIESSPNCGSCNTILWGMYHYQASQGSAGCNSTSSTYGDHASAWDGRTITYPICNGGQTSNGQFWIAVR
jgi:Big-like domain-containing protein